MVLSAALSEFARAGFDGTSTETIAHRAGISQPYLFRLFPNKKALFVAAVEQCFRLVLDTFEQVTENLAGEDAMVAMGEAYGKLIADRDLLMLQMQAYARCDVPEIRDATRDGYGHLWEAVARIGGCDEDSIREFFARGMLWNVVAAMQLHDHDAPWAQMCLPEEMRGQLKFA